ncbi:nuclear factor NF-kappa-B p110 subunit-like isoform X2 [Agrilus planipennis]|uniref:Nuclear factor NF-kappa-B p110 subunit-like isoform X2 n=1 Tax=Agrilus planipennis TaxID=224129 RepID=A0A1W4XGQ1_AGRPL|nr:nuclear factor NF-kappa-B p110 subunit-like isoform X2 [Agrilus planipennis]
MKFLHTFTATALELRFNVPIDIEYPELHSVYFQRMGLNKIDKGPYLELIVQPSTKFRYRYESEGATIHRLLHSQNGAKSYPTVKLFNYGKPAFIRCLACRTEDEQYKIHCHSFKMKNVDDIRDPVYLSATEENNFTVSFQGSLIFTKKRDANETLNKKLQRIRAIHRNGHDLSTFEEVSFQIDDFKNININKVVLRFDAYEYLNGQMIQICKPVYSQPILNQKVKVRFFNETWEDFGIFDVTDIHRQFAIVLRTPRYVDVNIDSPVKVKVELVRGDERSEPRTFIYLPQYEVNSSNEDANLFNTSGSDTE